MDKYFFIDDTILGGFLFAIIAITITAVITIGAKKKFKFKLYPLIPLILIFICRIIVSEIIDRNDNNNFIKSKVNSVVTVQKELKASKRCKLKNGLVFYVTSSAYVYIQIDDSIVKNANSDSLQIFRKDYMGKYILEKRCRYNEIR